MPVGRAHYVKGVQIAYPNGVRWLAGPYEESADAWAEKARLAPLYPEATLRVEARQGKTLPVIVASRGKPKPNRRATCEALVDLAGRLGLPIEVQAYPRGEYDVDIETPNLRASIWLADVAGLAVDWSRARWPLAPLSAVWGKPSGHKATTHALRVETLLEALEIGLLASIDGAAFERVES